MQNSKNWNRISKHLSEEETLKEKENFFLWLNEKEENKQLFEKLKSVWDGLRRSPSDKEGIVDKEVETKQMRFRERFTKQKMKELIIKQSLGNFVGFVVGMWVTSTFSNYVLERRGLHNLFGLAGRKKVEVNIIPEWMQTGIAILVGFITLELINHFFQTKKHIAVYEYFKRMIAKNK